MITEKLKQIREESGLTQAELASKLDMERSNYARLENRGELLTIAQLKAICRALDVSVLDVIDESNNQASRTGKNQELKEVNRKLRELKTENGLLRNFTNWVTMLFRDEFSAMKKNLLDDVTEAEPPNDETLKKLGKVLFSYEDRYLFWSLFMASSGFISEKWFLDAYKRSARQVGHKTNTAEVINWVNGVLDYISEVDEDDKEKE
ncbi:hypothetical protein GCM10023091_42980 [Ravibacter arvi]|uniref:HTH cro/C1-type domain-containing protein n=1 Tax=Ravibacter arvi TaxID=2051041 RepID=A0ABP8MB36_9BACT